LDFYFWKGLGSSLMDLAPCFTDGGNLKFKGDSSLLQVACCLGLVLGLSVWLFRWAVWGMVVVEVSVCA
jgi:hypothetical protein